ncbi:hypothetical protein GGR51DRAFT_502129 [Nemania sp. FL0031]|nr:hypothetical protein GGR51DRAFT_502129 [Nemania sp. FL0031]
MAPVTRRAAKAQGNSSQEEPIVSSTPNATPTSKPIALRSKRKTPKDTTGEDTKDTKDMAQSAKVATPKPKKLEVRIRDDGLTVKKSPIQVQIPSSAIKTPRSRSSPVPDSEGSNSDASDEANQTFEPLSASKQLEEEATQKLASRARMLEAGLETTPMAKAAKPTRIRSGKKVPSQLEVSESEAEAEEEEETPRPKPAAAKSTHVVFGDDDDVDKFVAAAADKEKEALAANAGNGDNDEEEEEDSDDEAPEAVSTAAAAKETLKSARAAIEAAEKYAASTKKKRQARDNLLKQQAEKRKRTEPSKSTPGEGDSSEDEAEEEQIPTSKRQRRTRDLPDTLPAEFLTDSSEDEDEAELKKMVKRPKKINFETALGAEGKRPRDEVVGSTRYRVLADQGDQRFAPKANKTSRRVREDLLRRGRTRVELNKKRGFFVKR